MSKPHYVQWYLDGMGYNVTVYDADSQPVDEYSAGNHPGDSQAVGREHKVGSLKLLQWAEQTAGEFAMKHGLEARMISHDADSEVDHKRFFDMTVCVWKTDSGYVWDDAEDHGGFDRLVPSNPFPTERAAMEDAEKTFPNTSIYFEHGKPLHYQAEEQTPAAPR